MNSALRYDGCAVYRTEGTTHNRGDDRYRQRPVPCRCQQAYHEDKPSHANEKRPCEVFQKFYFHLLGHYKFPTSRGSRKKKSPKLIDTTTISLNMNDFSWAKFRSSKGGIKINTRFDHDLACTDYLFITNANRHENSTFGQIRLTENDIAIFDRGYFNKRQFQELAESSISFVTRNKSNIEYEVISSDKKEKSDDSFTIRRDEIIKMKIGQSNKNHTYVTLRQVVSRDNDAERKLHS